MYPRSKLAYPALNPVSFVNDETGRATPEPVGYGEHTIMRDAGRDPGEQIELDAMETDDFSLLEKGTSSWLGRCHYDGEWWFGKYHGGGHHIDTNGDEYLGRFENGLKHGYGKMTYSGSGDVYDGEWAHGQHHGPGKLTEFATGNVFEGNWVEGKKRGAFVLRGTVTEEDKAFCKICYVSDLSTAFAPCGHVITCQSCAAQVNICPTCRRPIQSRLQLYGVGLSSG